MPPRRIYIGTAAWAIPREHAGSFPAGESALHRYAQVLPAAELNSTFYRPHRASTFARWRESVPPDFRFAVKLPRAITHEARLQGAEALLAEFIESLQPLGDSLGPLLVQLPPSLAFEPASAAAFFRAVRALCTGPLVCEPRHPSWLDERAESLLRAHDIARVAADPARPEGFAAPGGARSLTYLRLHGSPRRYYSPYGPERLEAIAQQLVAEARHRPVWCIFDNTASGAAAGDALWTRGRVEALEAAAHPPPT